MSVITRNGWLLGVIATLFGAAIIGSHIESGQTRWSASAWSFALEVPGSPATWGVAILIAGILLLLGSWKKRENLRIAGAWAACMWFCALDFAAVLALMHDLFDKTPDTVNPLSVCTWSVFAVMYRLHIQDEHEISDKRRQTPFGPRVIRWIRNNRYCAVIRRPWRFFGRPGDDPLESESIRSDADPGLIGVYRFRVDQKGA